MNEMNPFETLRQISGGYCLARAVHVLAELNVADALGETAQSATQLAEAVGAANCQSIKLRAERADAGNGRVYRVNLRVTDTCDASTNAIAKVYVPRSGPAVDDGPSAGYTVTGR